MTSHPNGVAVGDVTLLVVSTERTSAPRAVVWWLVAWFTRGESFDLYSGTTWEVRASRGGTVLASRSFRSRAQAERVRDYLAATTHTGQPLDWPTVLANAPALAR